MDGVHKRQKGMQMPKGQERNIYVDCLQRKLIPAAKHHQQARKHLEEALLHQRRPAAGR